MAGKVANKQDKGRCGRCCLSYSHHESGNVMCYRYGSPVARVAWNCKAPSGGYRKSEIKDECLLEIEKLKALTSEAAAVAA